MPCFQAQEVQAGILERLGLITQARNAEVNPEGSVEKLKLKVSE